MKKDKIPTAIEILKQEMLKFIPTRKNDKKLTEKDFEDALLKDKPIMDVFTNAMREFAEIHVKAAIEAVKNAPIEEYDEGGYLGIDEKAIDESYPLSNIK